MAGGSYAALSGLRTRLEQLDRLASDEVAQAFLESTLPLTYLAAPGSNETVSEPLLGALSERFDFRCLRHPDEEQ